MISTRHRTTTHLLLAAALLSLQAACASRPVADGARAAVTSRGQSVYFPAPGNAWEKRRPAELGLDNARIDSAVAFAQASETRWLKNMAEQLKQNTAREPYPDILGPYKDRGGPAGIILRNGYIVAEWGDTERVDMTFSVAKSYVSTVAGLALDRGLIASVHDPVRRTVTDGGFDSPHNAPITWHMMLNQTNEWEGTLWDKPDVADRRAGRDRSLNAPGTFWEYNDVRVNRTALALLRVWKRPLPEVLKELVMDPIGASPTWEWHGYRNAYVGIGGRRVQSVSGGGHWGGGMWASTRDHARFGYLFLRRGKWKDRQLLSERWIQLATTPTDIKPVYGYMWWLNTNRAQYKSAPASSFFALGAGNNVIWIDPEHDIVAVVRWIEGSRVDGFLQRVVASTLAAAGAR